MVASEQLATGDQEALLRAEATGRGLHVVQLAGRDPRWMADGARAAAGAGAAIIDINMGCPAKKVTGGYSGSALMRNLDHAVRLIDATVSATHLPVTLKMRLGWDENSLNAAELAGRAERAGVRMITVHGRTRCQFYTGAADWAAIRAVKDAVSIPVIANGDMVGRAEVEGALRLSGADGVMIGRGAYGRPWLPGELVKAARGGSAPRSLARHQLLSRVADHYQAMIAHYGMALGVRVARKHLGWYLDELARQGDEVAPADRRALLTAAEPRQVHGILAALVCSAERRAA